MNIKPKKNNKKKKTFKYVPVEAKVSNSNKIVVKEIKPVETKHSYLDLPLKEIKLDLVGMLFFAGASLLAIILLKKYDVNLTTVFSLFSK